MTADVQNALKVIDGNSPGLPQQILVAEDNLGNLAYQMAPRVRGAMVGDANPLPARAPSVASVVSTALEAGRILSATACSLFSIHANTTTDFGWIMLLDATAVPSDGTVQPKRWWQVPANFTLDRSFNPPLLMAEGAVLVFSTSGPFTKTSTATAVFAGEAA